MLKALISLIESRYQNDTDFEKEFGIARSTVSAWRKGKLKSYKTKVNDLAIFFNVPVSDFYEPKEKSLSQKDRLIAEINDKLYSMDDDKLLAFRDMLAAFVQSKGK